MSTMTNIILIMLMYKCFIYFVPDVNTRQFNGVTLVGPDVRLRVHVVGFGATEGTCIPEWDLVCNQGYML